MKKFLEFITWCFFSTIKSIICTTIIAMLFFIIEEIGFVENINFKSIFFWAFVLPTHFLLFCLLSNTWIDRWRKAPETDRWRKAPETLKDKNDSESKAIKNKYEGNINSIEDKEVKQFCYDSSNPCPYCDTKFTHTALHCAVYFSDMERLKEAIELIKKVDGVEDYGVNDFYDSNSMCGKIFDTKDFNSRYITNIALSIGNIEIIKFLFQIIKTKGSEKLELCVGNDQFIIINPKNEESIIEAIDLYQYKKKTQTGKYILDKHQEQQDLIKNEHEKRLRGK